ncbi:MAG: hypothetical protein ACFE94_13355 [Candidatus Hodarchaeota archaeon]
MIYEEAATIPVGGLEAMHYLREANIKKGQKMLIIGASGSIGSIGIQLAKLKFFTNSKHALIRVII